MKTTTIFWSVAAAFAALGMTCQASDSQKGGTSAAVSAQEPSEASSKISKEDYDRIMRDSASSSMASLAPKLRSYEAKVRDDMEQGRYEEALKTLKEIKRVVTSNKLVTTSTDRPEEFECEFQLGHYQEVLDMAARSGIPDTLASGAVAISFIRTGKPQEARRYYRPEETILRYVSNGNYRSFLPGDSSAKQLESSFRLARGISLFNVMQTGRAEIEFEAADRLTPNQPLIAYFLGSALRSLGRTSEAVTYARVARRLGGPLGREADLFNIPIRKSPKAVATAVP